MHTTTSLTNDDLAGELITAGETLMRSVVPAIDGDRDCALEVRSALADIRRFGAMLEERIGTHRARRYGAAMSDPTLNDPTLNDYALDFAMTAQRVLDIADEVQRHVANDDIDAADLVMGTSYNKLEGLNDGWREMHSKLREAGADWERTKQRTKP
ncbi:MAG: hypothetical protein ACXVFM_00430 [Solirubrobacteraceae bacterium]